MPQSNRKFPWPRTKLALTTACSLALYIIMIGLSHLRNGLGTFALGMRPLLFTVFIIAGIVLLIRWIRVRVLWRLRNRLVVNYLLIGLAPFILLVTLFGIMSYAFSGQFAIFAATDEINSALNHMASENRVFALHVAHEFSNHDVTPTHALDLPDVDPAEQSLEPARTVTVFRDGKRVPFVSAPELKASAIDSVPYWTKGNFAGVVLDNKQIFMRAVNSVPMNGHVTTTVTSLPFDPNQLSKMAEGLGRVTLMNAVVKPQKQESGSIHFTFDGKTPEQNGKVGSVKYDDTDVDQFVPGQSITGGVLPPRAGLYDVNVTFLAPLMMRDWVSGAEYSAPLSVASRPSLLYHRLFFSSLFIGNLIKGALITIAALFAIIELFALIMASRLNRTITGSIADLYDATRRVDEGDLTHQIAVSRTDQLAELSLSFNRMTTSLKRLLAEQKEKERMQSELAIAQEVQNNLFPQGDIFIPGLELHGFCRPARSVSGDYYDFLLFGDTGLGLAIGDISGKGISAALLMATLHSAVRAYRFAAEELVYAEMIEAAMRRLGTMAPAKFECAELFESPARVLSLLNRHLYRSTQPEKYATLFLANYDGTKRVLTYSNAGQLPPLVLCATGEVKRLDKGGTVVGLLEGAEYEEDHLELSSGDILIAYSDGVTEPENDFGDFGEDRLIDLVRRYQKAPLSVITSQVMQSLDDWIGGNEQPDDITLVFARQN
jgi:sigma-B regulation protein RsbU (phosphoserine phosphatase)